MQTDGAENRKACLGKTVLVNGWTSSGMADEHDVIDDKRIEPFHNVAP